MLETDKNYSFRESNLKREVENDRNNGLIPYFVIIK